MLEIYKRIERYRKLRDIPKMEFYKLIQMSDVGYAAMVKNHTIKLATLEKIAAVLNVPVSMFFESDGGTTTSEDAPESTDTAAPDNLAAARSIMALDIPAEEKARLLQNTVELFYTTIQALKTAVAVQEAEIQRLKTLLDG